MYKGQKCTYCNEDEELGEHEKCEMCTEREECEYCAYDKKNGWIHKEGNNIGIGVHTAIGNNALLDNLVGVNNVAIGNKFTVSDNAGMSSIAIGSEDLKSENLEKTKSIKIN